MLGESSVFLDTCIVIEYLKVNIVVEKSNCYINNIVLMELFIGAKNKKELLQIKAKLQGFNLLEIDKDVLNLATKIVEKYSLSHNAKIQDSIIASTCLIYNLPLGTYNIKDFKYISNLKLHKGV